MPFLDAHILWTECTQLGNRDVAPVVVEKAVAMKGRIKTFFLFKIPDIQTSLEKAINSPLQMHNLANSMLNFIKLQVC